MPSKRFVACLAVVAGIFNISPWLFSQPHSDVFFHYALIDCFDWQFWHGDWKPSWCMQANAGLGSPVFLFYFPLPYYVAALLHPLRSFGMTTEGIYVCSLALASMATFYTVWLWLADCFGKKRGLLLALLFLWMPYRSELLFFRAAYTELWGLAFIPLLLLALRRAVLDHGRWLHVAAALALCFITHPPTALITLLGGGIYILMLSEHKLKSLVKLGLCAAWAAALLSIYTVPAEYFLSSLDPAGLVKSRHVWANDVITWQDWQLRPALVLVDAFMWCGCLFLGVSVWRQRANILGRRELAAWLAIATIAFFMFLPTSTFLWEFLRMVGPIITPWRMQQLIMFATVYLLGVRITYLLLAKQLSTAKWDYAGLLIVLMVAAQFITTSRLENTEADKKTEAMQWAVGIEYKPRWSDAEHSNYEYISNHQQNSANLITALHGDEKISHVQLESGGIRFEAGMPTDGELLVHHWYFPIWHARMDGAETAILPQANTGEILIHVPAGKHEIWLYHNIKESIPKLYLLSLITSILAAVIFIVLYCRVRGGVLKP